MNLTSPTQGLDKDNTHYKCKTCGADYKVNKRTSKVVLNRRSGAIEVTRKVTSKPAKKFIPAYHLEKPIKGGGRGRSTLQGFLGFWDKVVGPTHARQSILIETDKGPLHIIVSGGNSLDKIMTNQYREVLDATTWEIHQVADNRFQLRTTGNQAVSRDFVFLAAEAARISDNIRPVAPTAIYFPVAIGKGTGVMQTRNLIKESPRRLSQDGFEMIGDELRQKIKEHEKKLLDKNGPIEICDILESFRIASHFLSFCATPHNS